ncbi:SLC13 family permease [Chenggangzhangella methanolivorans]|uniref:Anion permease n=1 Tax=Chenggangzhangella methanolivorans TaxID=1437009 RepID=A0A9E6R9C5_9HYPH|nr:SLC13 family permease [Chenggangzhangella methanolivorans]QZN99022.1 anion permease [Chenggangzhangella methanolivorans]
MPAIVFGEDRDGGAFAKALAGLRAKPALAASLVAVALVEIVASGLDAEARRALQIFLLALIGWTLTKLDDAFVALAAALAMALLVLDEPDEMFEALGDEIVWLMLAAFVLAAAARATGLTDRLASLALSRARTTRGAFHALTAVMLASAFVAPSTSGRAALMVPIYERIAEARGPEARRALALLFPTVILLSAFASLTGAGAHALAAQILDEIGDGEIGFLSWALYGLPFAAASSFLSAEAVLRRFVPRQERSAAFTAPVVAETVPDRRAGPVLAILGAVLLGWLTKPLHGTDETVVALIGACAVTAPGLGGVDFKAAVKGVEWPLILFMAATVVIAEGLDESGLVKAAAKAALDPLQSLGLPPLAWLLAIALAGLLSHLVIHSRTARVAVLLPPALVAAEAAGVSTLAAMLTLVAATGFCQLLMVSAKPVALFGQLPGGTFGSADLLRLGAVLLPLQLILIALFAGVVWPLLGLDLAD